MMKATAVSTARREYILNRLNTSLNASDFRPIWHGHEKIPYATGIIVFPEDKVFWGSNALEKKIVLDWLTNYWERLIVCKQIELVGDPIRDSDSGEIAFGYRDAKPKLFVKNLNRLTDRLKNDRRKKTRAAAAKRRK